MPEPELPILHCYGPDAHHDPVHLVGTRRALVQLAHQILGACAYYKEPRAEGYEPQEFLTNDGEGFEVKVHCVSEEQMERYALPYWLRDPKAEQPPDWPKWRTD